jgi:L-aminopeptidase/D-esterase-like protein
MKILYVATVIAVAFLSAYVTHVLGLHLRMTLRITPYPGAQVIRQVEVLGECRGGALETQDDRDAVLDHYRRAYLSAGWELTNEGGAGPGISQLTFRLNGNSGTATALVSMLTREGGTDIHTLEEYDQPGGGKSYDKCSIRFGVE